MTVADILEGRLKRWWLHKLSLSPTVVEDDLDAFGCIILVQVIRSSQFSTLSSSVTCSTLSDSMMVCVSSAYLYSTLPVATSFSQIR